MTSGVELVSTVPPFEIVDDLKDVTTVLVFAFGEVDLFVSLDVVHQIVIDGLEGFVEDFEMVSS